MAKIAKTWNEIEPVEAAIVDGFTLPSSFTANAELGDGTVVTVAIVVEQGRARSRRVSVETERPGGVTSTTLRSVPIREVVAAGLTRAIRRVAISPDGSAVLREIDATDADVVNVIARLVGYIEVRGKDGRLLELRGGEVSLSVKPARKKRRS
jgi:hypothetical protein